MSQKSEGEEAFAAYWEQFAPDSLRDRLERQYQFEPTRKWKSDFRIGWVLVEVDGGVFVQGRHNRGQGMIGDMIKLNRATSMGFRVLRFATQMIMDDPEAVVLLIVSTYLRANRDERRESHA